MDEKHPLPAHQGHRKPTYQRPESQAGAEDDPPPTERSAAFLSVAELMGEHRDLAGKHGGGTDALDKPRSDQNRGVGREAAAE